VKCFPGSKIVLNRRKPGVRREDEKPSTVMINNCRPLLERQIAL
jgi:uracil-DNA glycosylase